jgi:hypothetical protein
VPREPRARDNRREVAFPRVVLHHVGHSDGATWERVRLGNQNALTLDGRRSTIGGL